MDLTCLTAEASNGARLLVFRIMCKGLVLEGKCFGIVRGLRCWGRWRRLWCGSLCFRCCIEDANGLLALLVFQVVRWQPARFPRRGPPPVPGRRPIPMAPARILKIWMSGTR